MPYGSPVKGGQRWSVEAIIDTSTGRPGHWPTQRTRVRQCQRCHVQPVSAQNSIGERRRRSYATVTGLPSNSRRLATPNAPENP